MKKAFICYVDMDGVLNLFENDPKARLNMWNPGYYLVIPVRPGIVEVLMKINAEAHVVILSKVIHRIGVTKEKEEWMRQNINPEAYSDIIYVPYDRSKSDYMYSYYPAMLIDDNERNLEECAKNGCHGLFLSDIKVSQKYENAKTPEDIWRFYQNLMKNL